MNFQQEKQMYMWKKGENSAILKSILPLIEDTIKGLEKQMEVHIYFFKKKRN